MRWIFYAMVAINLAMFAWITNKPAPKSHVAMSVVEDVGDLKIVSDVELVVRADFQKKKQADLQRKLEKTGTGVDRPVPEDVVFVDKGVSKVCRRLGPFPERKIAVGVADGLAAYRLAPKVIEDQQIDILGYWALLPALSTKAEADLLVKKLKSRGIQDVRRFTSGDFINAISLGLFSSEANARRRAKSVETQGFLAVVQPKEEEKKNFWLQFTQPQDLELPLDGVKANYPDLQNKPCPGIAQN
jgi:hypothetical protein